jgi:hypothetical protein
MMKKVMPKKAAKAMPFAKKVKKAKKKAKR